MKVERYQVTRELLTKNDLTTPVRCVGLDVGFLPCDLSGLEAARREAANEQRRGKTLKRNHPFGG